VCVELIFAVDENTSSSLAVDVNVIPTPHFPPPLGVEPFLLTPAEEMVRAANSSSSKKGDIAMK